MGDPTTNAAVRNHFEDQPSPFLATDSPANGADTVVATNTRIHVVDPDGTNTVDLDAAARAGHRVTVVHNGGSNTPTLSFADADFVNGGPNNITTDGGTATLVNTDGSTSGWAIVSTA